VYFRCSDVVLKARPWPPGASRPNFYGLGLALGTCGLGLTDLGLGLVFGSCINGPKNFRNSTRTSRKICVK